MALEQALWRVRKVIYAPPSHIYARSRELDQPTDPTEYRQEGCERCEVTFC